MKTIKVEEETAMGKELDTQKYIDLLKANHNIILNGAPGTEKTYLAKNIAEEMGAEAKMVQFHPSYDYTDFVEGLRPIKDDRGNIGFERKDGVFKNFCKMALADQEQDFVFIIDEIKRGEISKIFGELLERMNCLNQVIGETEGLGSSYHVGGSMFLKIQNGEMTVEELWNITERQRMGKLNGYGAELYSIHLGIPKTCTSYSGFRKQMKQEEKKFCDELKKIK